jgi:hypothetical protein
MAGGREVDAEESGHGVIVREIVRGPWALGQGASLELTRGLWRRLHQGMGPDRPPTGG